MTHDVFISYSSKDKPISDGVCANLESAGIRCWIAPRDIAPGEDWPTAIARAISQSRIMVLVFSASSNSSEDVGRELILAANSKLVIIPFKIENVEPEPGKQYYLARTHWLDAMNPPTQGQITALVNRVKSILPATDPGDTTQTDRELRPSPLPKLAPKESRPDQRLVWMAGALLVLGIFAGIVSFWGLNRFATLAPTLTTMTPVLTPTFSPSSTPTASRDTLFSTDFNDSSFNGAFDSNGWFLRPGITLTSIKQTNGAMVFSKLSTSGSENGNLGTNQYWSLGEFSYIEARLKLDQEHTGENGNVAITLSDSGAWWAGCGIQAGNPTPFFWCGQGSQSGFDYMSDSYYLAYDKWYVARFEFNSQTNEFKGYIDGKLFYSWQPANASDLLKKKLLVSIGTWADNGTIITGYLDDVRVMK
jgi:hypothetical protein